MTRLTKTAPARPLTRQRAQEPDITAMSLEQRLKRKRRAKLFGDEVQQPTTKKAKPLAGSCNNNLKAAAPEVLVGYRLRKRIKNAMDAVSAMWSAGRWHSGLVTLWQNAHAASYANAKANCQLHA